MGSWRKPRLGAEFLALHPPQERDWGERAVRGPRAPARNEGRKLQGKIRNQEEGKILPCSWPRAQAAQGQARAQGGSRQGGLQVERGLQGQGEESAEEPWPGWRGPRGGARGTGSPSCEPQRVPGTTKGFPPRGRKTRGPCDAGRPGFKSQSFYLPLQVPSAL